MTTFTVRQIENHTFKSIAFSTKEAALERCDSEKGQRIQFISYNSASVFNAPCEGWYVMDAWNGFVEFIHEED